MNDTDREDSREDRSKERSRAVHQMSAQERIMRVVTVAIGVLLALVIVAPVALSSSDLTRWATSPDGLGLPLAWAVFVFVALDAAAATCVLFTVYSAWRGESAGAFSALIWVFAGLSAVANWRHGLTTSAPDDELFFPVMSVTGPLMLELTCRRVRRWSQMSSGLREKPLPVFRFTRWLPFVGSFRETYGAARVALLSGGVVSTPEDAVRLYRTVCPTGSVRVVRAIRALEMANGPAAMSAVDSTLPTVAIEGATEAAPATSPPRAQEASQRPHGDSRAESPAPAMNGAESSTQGRSSTVPAALSEPSAAPPAGSKADLVRRALTEQSGSVSRALETLAANGVKVSPGYAFKVKGEMRAEPTLSVPSTIDITEVSSTEEQATPVQLHRVAG